MPQERTFVQLLAGSPDPQRVDAPSVPYARTVGRLIASCLGAATGVDTRLQIALDTVNQLTEYVLPAGVRFKEISIGGGGVTVPADVVPGIYTQDVGLVSNIVVYIESEPAVDLGDETVWVQLTASDLQSRISSPEYEAFTASLLQQSQSDPVPKLLSDITQSVRTDVRSGRKVQLGGLGLIPPSLVDDALAIVKLRLFERVASLQRFAEAARPAAKEALQKLTEIATGKRTPETPDVPLATESTNIGDWGGETAVEQ